MAVGCVEATVLLASPQIRTVIISRAQDNARKRHLVVDTRGLPLLVIVTPASLSDRDAAKEVLFRLRLMHPEITIVWADSAYAGKLVTWAKKYLNLTIKTVSRPKDASGFIVLPRRWWSSAHTPGS
jgi:transposase